MARLDGEVVNVQPEFEDVAAAARALGRPVKTVMAERHRRSRRARAGLMDLAVIAIVFGAIFVVELPDKTFIAALVLSTRYKPLAVWVGVGLAFLVQTLIAVLAGHLTTYLPDALIKSVALVIFLVGGVLLFRSAPGADAEEKEQEEEFAAKAVESRTGLQAVGAVVPGALRRRVGRPVPAADDQHDREVRPPGERLRRRLGRAADRLRPRRAVGRVLLRYVRLSVVHYVGGAVCLVLAVITAVELLR